MTALASDFVDGEPIFSIVTALEMPGGWAFFELGHDLVRGDYLRNREVVPEPCIRKYTLAAAVPASRGDAVKYVVGCPARRTPLNSTAAEPTGSVGICCGSRRIKQKVPGASVCQYSGHNSWLLSNRSIFIIHDRNKWYKSPAGYSCRSESCDGIGLHTGMRLATHLVRIARELSHAHTHTHTHIHAHTGQVYGGQDKAAVGVKSCSADVPGVRQKCWGEVFEVSSDDGKGRGNDEEHCRIWVEMEAGVAQYLQAAISRGPVLLPRAPTIWGAARVLAWGRVRIRAEWKH